MLLTGQAGNKSENGKCDFASGLLWLFSCFQARCLSHTHRDHAQGNTHTITNQASYSSVTAESLVGTPAPGRGINPVVSSLQGEPKSSAQTSLPSQAIPDFSREGPLWLLTLEKIMWFCTERPRMPSPQSRPGCLWLQTLYGSWHFLINLLSHTFVESCHCSFNIQHLCQVWVSKYLSSELQRFPEHVRKGTRVLELCDYEKCSPDGAPAYGKGEAGWKALSETSKPSWISCASAGLPTHSIVSFLNSQLTFSWHQRTRPTYSRHMCYMPTGLYTCGPAWQEGHRIFRIPKSAFIRRLCHVFLHISVSLIPERKIIMAPS